MRTLDQIIHDLPAERRAKVTTRTQKLIAEEMALRHLRRARDLTQESMAKLLHIDQAGISKIENRSDMLLSTLRSYIEAMGGSLRLVAEFPDGIAELSSLGEALDTAAPTRTPKRRVRRKATASPDKARERKKRHQPQLVHAND
jgi:transcriptional regulator with XRE-family HTH domain